MLITLFLAHLFRLNKVIALVAANISIPPMIPLLLYGSYRTGCMVLGNPPDLHLGDLSLENVKSVFRAIFNRKHYLCNGLQSAVWSNLHRVAGYM